MGRTLGWLALLAAAVSSTGCKMGQSTYDYTGPAYQNGYQNGGFFYRRGSILGPGDPLPQSAAASMPDPQPTVAPLQPTPPADGAAPNP